MISVFTPFHKIDNTYLRDAYDSIRSQTYTDWEWVIVLNGEGTKADIDFLLHDSRVKTFVSVQTNNIGYLKKYACSKCSGDLIVEFDFDDLLTKDCLEEIYKAFKDKKVQMAYSNCAQFHSNTWEPILFMKGCGWLERDFEYTYKGEKKQLVEVRGWPPSSQMMRRIEWAPNHVRAWRKSSYYEIGGHDETLILADDHDLCCRYYIKYGEEGIKFIDKCLYLYRVHGKNSCVVGSNESPIINNEKVMEQTDKNYVKYSRQMAIRWAKENNLRMLDLGGRFNSSDGFETVDLLDADIICDLNKKWKFKDNSIGIIKASHIFEHLDDPIHVMNEAYRVLAGGGWLFIEVPSTDGRGAFQDPTHRSFWNSNSFWYYTQESHAQYIRPKYKGRFQCSRIINWFPSKFEEDHNILICEADLICLKPPYRHSGKLLI